MKKVVIVCAPCGTGKSTIIDYINDNNAIEGFTSSETDLLCWWDYAGTTKENRYFNDALDKALGLSKDKNLIFSTCVNPVDVRIRLKEYDIDLSVIGLMCSSEETRKRLLARPKERNTSSDEFINSQIEYMNWFRNNEHEFDLLIDNSNQEVKETVDVIYSFIKKRYKL